MADQFMKKSLRILRGIFLLVIFGPIFLFCGLNAVILLISYQIGSLSPGNWYSGNSADWLFGGGQDAGAYTFISFMINGALTLGSAAVIRWGFMGRETK
jgi:hypothetical protein